LSEPEPTVIFKGFGDSSLDFVLRVFTRDYMASPLMLQSDINFKIFKEFKKSGIEIPFPQRDIHIRSASGDMQL
jgi:small-conductance mechanosensitive channel